MGRFTASESLKVTTALRLRARSVFVGISFWRGPSSPLVKACTVLGLGLAMAFPTFGEAPAPLAPKQATKEDSALEKMKDEVRRSPKDVKAVVRLAEELHRRGRNDDVTVLLWTIVEKLDRPAMLLLIRAHEERKEWSDVARAASLLIARSANDEEALTKLGNAQLMRGKVADAKESLKKALEANKKYEPAYEVLAKIYEKNLYEQRLLYQDMVETFGPKAAFLTKLCSINTTDGENEQGEQVCSQAIKADDSIPENHVNRGLIAKQKGDLDQARALLKTAAERFSKSEYAQYQYGAFLESEKNYLDAFVFYEKCAAADRQSDRCLVGMGNTGVQIQKDQSAYEAFDTVCRRTGRKYSQHVRKAITVLRQRKNFEWTEKFDRLADRCLN